MVFIQMRFLKCEVLVVVVHQKLFPLMTQVISLGMRSTVGRPQVLLMLLQDNIAILMNLFTFCKIFHGQGRKICLRGVAKSARRKECVR